MNKDQEKLMMQKAQDYASKQGTMEYESSKEDFIEGWKQAFALYHVVGQSEQLKAFAQWCYDKGYADVPDVYIEEYIDESL